MKNNNEQAIHINPLALAINSGLNSHDQRPLTIERYSRIRTAAPALAGLVAQRANKEASK